MNFDGLTGIIQDRLMNQMKAQIDEGPMSATIYSCPNGHQAVVVKSGPDSFSWLDHVSPDMNCRRCMGTRGQRVQMK